MALSRPHGSRWVTTSPEKSSENAVGALLPPMCAMAGSTGGMSPPLQTTSLTVLRRHAVGRPCNQFSHGASASQAICVPHSQSDHQTDLICIFNRLLSYRACDSETSPLGTTHPRNLHAKGEPSEWHFSTMVGHGRFEASAAVAQGPRGETFPHRHETSLEPLETTDGYP